MDNASDYESEDCRFDPCQDRIHIFFLIPKFLQVILHYTVPGMLCEFIPKWWKHVLGIIFIKEN
jgi:hypothetical protein